MQQNNDKAHNTQNFSQNARANRMDNVLSWYANKLAILRIKIGEFLTRIILGLVPFHGAIASQQIASLESYTSAKYSSLHILYTSLWFEMRLVWEQQ